MTEDEQSGTLAFLQNFYTGVTLYVPREAQELPAAQAPMPAQLAAASLPATATPDVAKQLTPVIAATPPASKLPSLATEPPAPAATSAPPANRPGPLPIAAAPVAPYLLTTFSTLGSNAQGVVVLVRLPAEQFVKLPRNVFLNRLLQAIQLVMADVVLVNVEGVYPVALENLRKEIAATHILAFGKNLLDVAVRTTQIYEPVQFPAVGLSYLAGAEVEMIEYDVSLKKRLWGGLQRMFLA
ncbi:hypothetical protein [Hymenobacter sp. BRD67]|uniref:hypothetical protein n=1 Tax=Hymenobacter sp. BRD67 TaxID=2675877 RepID=UPI00156598E0|nr:hypothetical protein [Hymenobacter sp. BRD67]QKG52394.1 hypothetical protein GKZ67_06955 [Hymenobacter sp. BRD67]